MSTESYIDDDLTDQPPSSSSSESETPFDVEQSVRDLFEAEGITPSEQTVAAVTKMVEAFGEVRSAKLVGRLFSQLPDGPGTEAVFRVVFGARESLRDAAQRIGCSHSAILRAEGNFARLVGLRIFAHHPFGKINHTTKSKSTNETDNPI